MLSTKTLRSNASAGRKLPFSSKLMSTRQARSPSVTVWDSTAGTLSPIVSFLVDQVSACLSGVSFALTAGTSSFGLL